MLVLGVLLFMMPRALVSENATDHLSGNTVLIVRHAEKPEKGRELTAQGEARARAYVKYFEPFREDGLAFHVDALYAGADSGNSIRPRLTLEPLQHATGMPLHLDVETDNSPALVEELRNEPHGSHPLIAWRHGQIPKLLANFGASPAKILPNGRWPDDVYDWVIVLAFDGKGHLVSQQLVHEHLDISASN
jgi:hypothetical protein